MDKGIQKDQVTEVLPLLNFADKVMRAISPMSHEHKLQVLHPDFKLPFKSVESKYRLAQSCFTRCALNQGPCSVHRDFGVGLDLLMYSGDFYGGELVVPQLQLKIAVKQGDVVILDSGVFHYTESCHGDWYSMVFFTKQHHGESASGSLQIPPHLTWSSEANFGLF